GVFLHRLRCQSAIKVVDEGDRILAEPSALSSRHRALPFLSDWPWSRRFGDMLSALDTKDRRCSINRAPAHAELPRDGRLLLPRREKIPHGGKLLLRQPVPLPRFLSAPSLAFCAGPGDARADSLRDDFPLV